MEAHITFKGASHVYALPAGAEVAALKQVIHDNLQIEPELQKLLCKGKRLIDTDPVPSEKIMVLGSTSSSVSAVTESLSHQAVKTRARQAALSAAPSLSRTAQVRDLSSTSYTFHSISALPLHNSQAAESLLRRLAQDAAIVKLMQRHHLRVGHLTELDPRTNTSHDSKLLGLNKNGGAEILLRLRTDDMVGFRDYKGIKSTLIHELTHNTYGEHDDKFWNLFKEYSRQVAEFESGRSVGMEEVYIPEDGKSVDHGVAWVGGGGKLGSQDPAKAQTAQTAQTAQSISDAGTSAREQRARAAEERSKAAKR